MCWHGCGLPAQRVCVCTAVLTPERGLFTPVCSPGGAPSPPQNPSRGAAGARASQWQVESSPATALSITLGQQTTGSTGDPPQGPRPPLPSGLSQAARRRFVSGHGARCITCLLVHRAGAGGESVGSSMPRGFAWRAGFPAPGKSCKHEPVPHPAPLATQPLPCHCPGQVDTGCPTWAGTGPG